MNYSPLGPSDADEAPVILAARCGDDQALAELLKRHGPAVRRQIHINPRWSSVVDVDDIMQISYYEAFRHITRTHSDIRSFRAWLLRIAEHNLRDVVEWFGRGKRPQPERRVLPPADQDSLCWLYELVSGTGTTPSGSASRRELNEALAAALDGLPDDYGYVVRSVYWEQRGVAEVAEMMHRSRGAVHLLRIRAIERLREHFGGSAHAPFD